MAEAVPSVGRVVHVVLLNRDKIPVHAAAVITSVSGNTVEVYVLPSIVHDVPGQSWVPVPFDASGSEVGSWHWPEFVPPMKPG
jgi:hypothetical protein